MPLTPEQIEGKEFSVTLRGYEKEEVEAFLVEVAEEIRALRARGPAAATPAAAVDPYEHVGQEVSSILKAAKDSAETLRRQAQSEADRVRGEAAHFASEQRRQAQEEAAATRSMAAEAAQKSKTDAERHSAELRATAERERRELLDAAQRRYDLLKARENDLRARIVAVEEALGVLQTEMEKGAAEDDAGLDRAEARPATQTTQTPPKYVTPSSDVIAQRERERAGRPEPALDAAREGGAGEPDDEDALALEDVPAAEADTGDASREETPDDSEVRDEPESRDESESSEPARTSGSIWGHKSDSV